MENGLSVMRMQWHQGHVNLYLSPSSLTEAEVVVHTGNPSTGRQRWVQLLCIC